MRRGLPLFFRRLFQGIEFEDFHDFEKIAAMPRAKHQEFISRCNQAMEHLFES